MDHGPPDEAPDRRDTAKLDVTHEFEGADIVKPDGGFFHIVNPRKVTDYRRAGHVGAQAGRGAAHCSAAALRDERLRLRADLAFQTVDIEDLAAPKPPRTVRVIDEQELLDAGLSACADSARFRGTALGQLRVWPVPAVWYVPAGAPCGRVWSDGTAAGERSSPAASAFDLGGAAGMIRDGPIPGSFPPETRGGRQALMGRLSQSWARSTWRPPRGCAVRARGVRVS